jgi:hypothetical protein
MLKIKDLFAASTLGLALTTASHATSIDLTFSNENGFGFLVTPVYVGLHSGGFDAFNEGDPATPGIEQIAELPVPPNPPNLIASERLAVEPNSQGGFIFGPGGPILDGESGTLTLDVADPATNRFASFLAMFVPSNDTFFGNDNPLAYEIFDDMGNLIEQTIAITAQSVWDAGTEINQLLGAAFPGEDIQLGDTEGGVITRLLDINDGSGGDGFDALEGLFGAAVAGAGTIMADTVLFSIDVAETPAQVPVPTGSLLLLAGMVGLSAMRRAGRGTTAAA